jgi:hypothetical protein
VEVRIMSKRGIKELPMAVVLEPRCKEPKGGPTRCPKWARETPPRILKAQSQAREPIDTQPIGQDEDLFPPQLVFNPRLTYSFSPLG